MTLVEAYPSLAQGPKRKRRARSPLEFRAQRPAQNNHGAPRPESVELKTVLRSPYLVCLIGAGIQASRMPSMHEHEAAEQGLHCEYQLIDLAGRAIKRINRKGRKGKTSAETLGW